MKTIVTILSLAIALNLGTHIRVTCDMPTCAMKADSTCGCDLATANDQADHHCNHMRGEKTPTAKCHQSTFDGTTVPVFTLNHIDTPIAVLYQNLLSDLSRTSYMFTPHPTDQLHFKPDKYLNLPLLI